MKQFINLICNKVILFVFLYLALSIQLSTAQQTTLKNYVLFGGSGYVQLGSASSVNGGSIGSYQLIQSTGNSQINANLYSGNSIQLSNGNGITGNVSVANASSLTGNVLLIGSNATIVGNLNVNGNTYIQGGSVTGSVTHPVGTIYNGPVPSAGNITGTPTLAGLPALRPITSFPAAGATDINSNTTITPGAYGNVSLTGNKTVILSGTGTYTFKAISNSGTTNNFVFDFKNDATGTIKIYVYGDADLGKISSSAKNGGGADKIFTEIHGNGSTTGGTNAFSMANGSSAKTATTWLGTVWVPYGGISIGSGTGNSTIEGALWSGTQLSLQSGVSMVYNPFIDCVTPTVNAGPDKPLDFANATTLTGSSPTPGASLKWTAINGGIITSATNAATINISAAGTYILTATSTTGCSASDTAIVTGKVSSLIGSELQSVYDNFKPSDPPSPFFFIRHDSIMIDVITIQGQYTATLSLLTSPTYGLTNILSNGTSNFIITGLYPISKLPLLNLLTSYIVYVRPYYGPFSNSGIVTSAGDVSMRSNLVRQGYQLAGDGIKVGVISDSYGSITSAATSPITNTALQDIANGDLPGPGNPDGYITPVHVVQDYPFKSSDEGRAMLQIVHDVAPKAELYFRTGFISGGDFAIGIDQLRQAGCNVIVDDVTFITEPFLKDGVVANAVDAATAAGTTYFSAAGNFANKSYENTFTPVPAPAGLTGTAHSFGGNDIFQSVTLSPGNYTIVLQWLDDIYSLGQTAGGGTKNDLDIYLTPNTDGTGLFGFNRNNTNGDPIEILPFTVSGTVNTNILIVNNTVGSTPARFKYVVFRGDIKFNEYATGTSTLVGQANSAGAIAVGAARFDKAPPFAGPLVAESFTSTGGTFVNNVQRNKPDLMGPDGVNTTVNLGIDYDNDSYSNFFGTSAAAPHAAAVAALIMEGKKKFSNQLVTSPAEIRSLLQGTATDMNTPGFDFVSGFGFINADSAMRTFAKPDPSLIKLVVPAAITPGTASFTLTVTGENISPSSVIKYRDSTLTTTFVNSTTATATVPMFVGNPSISVYTPPVSVSGLDGGSSDTLKFFTLPKKSISITVDNKIKNFAQQVPAFTTTILVDGVPLQNTQLTLANLGLANMTITSLATVGSDIGTYSINATRVFDPSNATDIGFLELYNYTFTQGTLTVEKLPITVTSNNATITYGQKIPDIQFTYQFDGTGITDPTALLNSIKSAHQSQLAKDADGHDVLGLVNGKAVTIFNGKAVTIFNGKAVTIFNGKAVTIFNGVTLPIVNAQALTITNGIVTDTIGAKLTNTEINNLSFLTTETSLQNARQITNKTLVNGSYVPGSTKIVDITQESILGYNVNAAQTELLTSVSDVNAKGLVDVESFVNGKAVTIFNGQAVTIFNGQAVTIFNGKAVTIFNGKAVTIFNGDTIPIVSSQNRTAVVIDETEIGQVNTQLKALNMITGFDVGDQFIIPGTLLNNNLEVTNIAGILKVLPAPVIITPASGLTKVFGTADPAFTYSNNAGLTDVDFTGALSRTTGENSGTYTYNLSTLSAGANYSLTLSAVTPLPVFTISRRAVLITPDAGQHKTYGDTDPVFTYTNNAGLIANNFTGALSRVGGSNFGDYAYTIGSLTAGNNYSLSLSAVNKFTIYKALLNVKADDKLIYAGSQLPKFTATITGLKNGDNPSVTYAVSPSPVIDPGIYTITPSLSSFANSINYTVSVATGNLYVNPSGKGTKKLRVYLDCVEAVANPTVPGLTYIAHFYCINDNTSMVYIPIGPDNLINSSGTFDNSKQPVVFVPGTTRCDVPFDGNALTWNVTSYESTHKTSVSSNASSGSNKCSNYVTSSRASKQVTTDAPEIVPAADVNIFPNPASSRTTIYLSNEIIDGKSLILFDIHGKSQQVKLVRQISQHAVEIDISRLVSGMYYLKLKVKVGYKTVKVLKQ